MKKKLTKDKYIHENENCALYAGEDGHDMLQGNVGCFLYATNCFPGLIDPSCMGIF